MARLAVLIVLSSLAVTAEAYVGPGMGLGVLGAAFGLVTAIFLGLVGMVWYPVKRLLRGKRAASAAEAVAARPTNAEPPP